MESNRVKQLGGNSVGAGLEKVGWLGFRW
jgi:hypothetical protein